MAILDNDGDDNDGDEDDVDDNDPLNRVMDTQRWKDMDAKVRSSPEFALYVFSKLTEGDRKLFVGRYGLPAGADSTPTPPRMSLDEAARVLNSLRRS